MQLLRHKYEIDGVAHLGNLILGYPCNCLRTAKLEVKVVLISHNLCIRDDRMLDIFPVLLQIPVFSLDILAPDTKGHRTFMSLQKLQYIFR